MCKTVFGNLLVGPTAEEQQSRDDASVDKENLQSLFKKGLVFEWEGKSYKVELGTSAIQNNRSRSLCMCL